MPWARNFCPFRAYWVISTVQVEKNSGCVMDFERKTKREK